MLLGDVQLQWVKASLVISVSELVHLKLTSESILCLSDFSESLGIRVSRDDTHILSNLFTYVATKERIGPLFDAQLTRYCGLPTFTSGVDFGDTSHQFGVSWLHTGCKLCIGCGILVSARKQQKK